MCGLTAFAELTGRGYQLFRKRVYTHSGINLGPKKQHLVRTRLGKRLRQFRFRSFKQHYERNAVLWQATHGRARP